MRRSRREQQHQGSRTGRAPQERFISENLSAYLNEQERRAGHKNFDYACFQATKFHAQKNQYVARAKGTRISSAGLAKIVIPVPSMEEQQRIVSILDKFDAPVNDLSIGLPAELAARRKQYEYY
jgi:type I restriction enzyme S subunit